MVKENDAGAGLGEHPLIQKLVPTPGQPLAVQRLQGYIGRSTDDSCVRLYSSLDDLAGFIDVPRSAIVAHEHVPASVLPFGGTALWVNADANVKQQRLSSSSIQAQFLGGPILTQYLPGAPGPGGAQPAGALPITSPVQCSPTVLCPSQHLPCPPPATLACPPSVGQVCPPSIAQVCPPSVAQVCPPSVVQVCPPSVVQVCPTSFAGCGTTAVSPTCAPALCHQTIGTPWCPVPQPQPGPTPLVPQPLPGTPFGGLPPPSAPVICNPTGYPGCTIHPPPPPPPPVQSPPLTPADVTVGANGWGIVFTLSHNAAQSLGGGTGVVSGLVGAAAAAFPPAAVAAGIVAGFLAAEAAAILALDHGKGVYLTIPWLLPGVVIPTSR